MGAQQRLAAFLEYGAAPLHLVQRLCQPRVGARDAGVEGGLPALRVEQPGHRHPALRSAIAQARDERGALGQRAIDGLLGGFGIAQSFHYPGTVLLHHARGVLVATLAHRFQLGESRIMAHGFASCRMACANLASAPAKVSSRIAGWVR
ncbi:hypothetical protein D3C81_1071220 [compost metagenome]